MGDGSSGGGGSWDSSGGWNINDSGGCWDISHGRGDGNGVDGGGGSGCTVNSGYGSALTCWAPMGVRVARCNGGGWVSGGGLDIGQRHGRGDGLGGYDRGCTQELPATKSKKNHKSSMYATIKKAENMYERTTNHSHAPPQIADFRSQRIKQKLTPRSILRDIHVALSQLWRRSGTLAWVVPATTSPK